MPDDLDTFYEASNRLDETLIADVETATHRLSTDDSQFTRRVYCRCLLALFEGVTENLKQHSLQFADALLGDDEKERLRKRLGALEGAFHAFDLYTNVAGAMTPLTRNSEEWLVLKKAIRIRNRITHPKCAEDLELSDLDMVHLRVTARVIFDVTVRCHAVTAQAIKRRAKLMEEARRNLEKNAEQAGAANPCPFGTSGTSPAEQAWVPEASRDT